MAVGGGDVNKKKRVRFGAFDLSTIDMPTDAIEDSDVAGETETGTGRRGFQPQPRKKIGLFCFVDGDPQRSDMLSQYGMPGIITVSTAKIAPH